MSFLQSWDNGIGTVTTCRQMSNRGLFPCGGEKFSSSAKLPHRLWFLPSLLLRTVTAALSPAVKQLGHEANHSPPSSAEVKNERSCTSTPPYAFIACTGTLSPCYNTFILINL